MTTLPQTVAIVGAGIAGLCCARELQAAGLSVVVFDKSRGVGGRVATRRGEEGAVFDHGAQYFTVKDPRFQQQVDDWLSAGVVARWPARIGTLRGGIWTPAEAETSRYVGVPAMTAIAKQMASDLEIHFQKPIQSIAHDNGHWKLVSDQERMFGPFDAVLSTAPAPQTKSILGEYAALIAGIERVEISPCWALKLVLAEPLPVPMDGAFVEDCPLSWIARNNSKPGRARVPECWVLQGAPGRSRRVGCGQTARGVLGRTGNHARATPRGRCSSLALRAADRNARRALRLRSRSSTGCRRRLVRRPTRGRGVP
jgi:predicted NAD/FAD-dependent oxidoreductase